MTGHAQGEPNCDRAYVCSRPVDKRGFKRYKHLRICYSQPKVVSPRMEKKPDHVIGKGGSVMMVPQGEKGQTDRKHAVFSCWSKEELRRT